MDKPIVKILQNQEVTTSTNIDLSNSEVMALIAKYGPIQPQTHQPIQTTYDPNQYLTFDQMIAAEEQKIKAIQQQKEAERMREMNKPTPYSFDRGSIRHHDTQYKSLDDGFGVEVKVVTNMDISKGY